LKSADPVPHKKLEERSRAKKAKKPDQKKLSPSAGTEVSFEIDKRIPNEVICNPRKGAESSCEKRNGACSQQKIEEHKIQPHTGDADDAVPTN